MRAARPPRPSGRRARGPVPAAPAGRRRRRAGLPAALVAACFTLALAPDPALGAQARDPVTEAQELIDAERPADALAALERGGKPLAKDPQALLLSSTARIMLGDVEAGRADLDRALELDPTLRQGWLNRAALDITDRRYPEALAALRRAQDLDPSAPDNDLNLGAVLLLAGDLSAASGHFQRYLAIREGAADASYLVATNYAIAGYAALAVEHLRQAIGVDERSRLEARTDPNFESLAAHPGFRELMAAVPRPPPPGAYAERRLFPDPYQAGEGELLRAVLDALQLSGQPFDPRVEVTPEWAVIWGDMRVVVRSEAGGKGSVELSAPAERFTPEEWRRRAEALLTRIEVRLAAGRG